MSESTERPGDSSARPIVNAPPLSAQPARAAQTDESRARLHRVAIELIRSRNRNLLTEFLTLRRSVA